MATPQKTMPPGLRYRPVEVRAGNVDVQSRRGRERPCTGYWSSHTLRDGGLLPLDADGPRQPQRGCTGSRSGGGRCVSVCCCAVWELKPFLVMRARARASAAAGRLGGSVRHNRREAGGGGWGGGLACRHNLMWWWWCCASAVAPVWHLGAFVQTHMVSPAYLSLGTEQRCPFWPDDAQG